MRVDAPNRPRQIEKFSGCHSSAFRFRSSDAGGSLGNWSRYTGCEYGGRIHGNGEHAACFSYPPTLMVMTPISRRSCLVIRARVSAALNSGLLGPGSVGTTTKFPMRGQPLPGDSPTQPVGYRSVSGGYGNDSTAKYSWVSGSQSTVGGGYNNTPSTACEVLP